MEGFEMEVLRRLPLTEGEEHFLIRQNRTLGFKPDRRRPEKQGADQRGRRYVQEWGWVGKEKDKRRRYVRRITLSRPDEEDDVILLTDLLEETRYPAEDLLEAYLSRWGIERMAGALDQGAKQSPTDPRADPKRQRRPDQRVQSVAATPRPATRPARPGSSKSLKAVPLQRTRHSWPHQTASAEADPTHCKPWHPARESDGYPIPGPWRCRCRFVRSSRFSVSYYVDKP